uniref:Hero resistance protein n=1 Tax=Solanum tuberosum TaxID=4113 RepID=M1CVN4_SOLTU
MPGRGNRSYSYVGTWQLIPVSYVGMWQLIPHLHCYIKEPIDPPTHRDWFPKFDVLNKLESLIAMYENAEYPDKIRQPNEYYFPNSLKELRLNGFPLRPDLLSVIAALPELEILEFIYCEFVEDKWDASEDIYQSLKTLSMRMVNHSEWQVDMETFPKLEELRLEHCYKLTEIPSAFIDTHTLKSIHLTNTKRELGDSAIEIKKQVEAFTGEDRPQVHIEDVYEEEDEEEAEEEAEEEDEEEAEEEEINSYIVTPTYIYTSFNLNHTIYDLQNAQRTQG